MHYTDVVIIGAGPVGLFAIFQCGMMKLKCHVIDALQEVGGQCTALYPEKPIYDIPAFPKIAAGDLITNLREQAEAFSPTYHLGQQVMAVEKSAGDSDYQWCVTTSNDQKIHAKVIIIAAGVGAFGPNRPPLDHLEQYEEKSIHYFVRQRETYRDKTIVIAGGGDSAVDWAISLSELAKKVYVVHRRAKFRAAPDSMDKLYHIAQNTDKVELVVPYQLSGLNGCNGQLQEVGVKTLDEEERTLKADYLLPFFGLAMNLGPIATWGLQLDKSHITVNPTTAETSTPGIFAIGDVATYENKLKLILCGFSEAAYAAHKAREIVYPGQAFHFEYSTTSGIPAAPKSEVA